MDFLHNRPRMMLSALCLTGMAMLAPGLPATAQDAPLLNGCSTYVDRTADDADRTLSWDYAIETNPERCIKIRVGQTVTFDGDLKSHPIDAQGGNAANPFKGAESSTPTFSFDKAGVFGFVCIYHEEMQGAVWVVG